MNQNLTITPGGIEKIKQASKGPIRVTVSIPSEFQIQNQRLQTQKQSKLIVQLKDDTDKASAYLCDEAYEKLSRRIMDNDLIEIQAYEIQHLKPAQKVIVITQAALLSSHQEAKEEDTDSIGFLDYLEKPQASKSKKKVDSSNSKENIKNTSTPIVEQTPSKVLPSTPKGKEFLGLNQNNNSSEKKSNQKINPSAEKLLRELSKGGVDLYTPICQLREFDEAWMIKAYVYNKGEIKHFNRKDGSRGSFFTVSLVDEDNSRITATFFEDAIVRKYSEFLQEGKTYAFSGGEVKYDHKKFGVSENNLQIVFDFKMPITITELTEGHNIRSENLYHFSTIEDIFSTEDGLSIDIIAVVFKVKPIESLTMNEGRPVPVKEIEIIDQSLKPVKVTCWNEKAHLDFKPKDLIMISQAKIKTLFGVKSLTISTFSEVKFDNLPDVLATRELRSWFSESYESEVKNVLTSVDQKESIKTIFDLENQKLEDNQLVWILAYVSYIYEDKTAVSACPNCKKWINSEPHFEASQTIPSSSQLAVPLKVAVADEKGVCTKCQTKISSPVKRNMTRIKLSDYTGSILATAFGPYAEKLILAKTENSDSQTQIFQEYKFQLKHLNYNNTKRFNIVKFLPLDYVDQSKDILSKLDLYKSIIPKDLVDELLDII